ALAGAAATSTFFGGFYAALYALYAIRELHLGPAALGLAVAAGGAGDLVGAVVAKRALRRFGLGRTLIGTALVGGCAGLLTPLAATVWLWTPSVRRLGSHYHSHATPGAG